MHLRRDCAHLLTRSNNGKHRSDKNRLIVGRQYSMTRVVVYSSTAKLDLGHYDCSHLNGLYCIPYCLKLLSRVILLSIRETRPRRSVMKAKVPIGGFPPVDCTEIITCRISSEMHEFILLLLHHLFDYQKSIAMSIPELSPNRPFQIQP